jgi:hypothetical protein
MHPGPKTCVHVQFSNQPCAEVWSLTLWKERKLI